MVLGIQIVGLAFGAGVLYISFLNYKRNDFTFNEFGFWSVFGIAFAGVSLFPNVLDPIVASLNLTRPLDLFIILGFIFLITGMYYTYTVTRRTQRMTEEIVRKIAFERKK